MITYFTILFCYIGGGSNTIVEIDASSGSILSTLSMTSFNNPSVYCWMSPTSDGLSIFFTAYITTGTAPVVWKANIQASTGICLYGFDPSNKTYLNVYTIKVFYFLV